MLCTFRHFVCAAMVYNEVMYEQGVNYRPICNIFDSSISPSYSSIILW